MTLFSGLKRLQSWIGLVWIAGAVTADDLKLTVEQVSPQTVLVGHGVTGDKVTLEFSTDLNSWSTIRGIVLEPGLRAKNAQQHGSITNADGTVWQNFGFPLPITSDGLVTFAEPHTAAPGGRYYRLRSPGRGWEDARERWTGLKIREYRYRFRRSCFCFGAPGEGIVHVKDGTVLDVEELNSPRVPPGPVAGDPKLYPTIDGLFRLMDQAALEGADVIEFHTDPELGIPTAIDINYLVGAADAGVGYSAGDFVRIE